MSKTRSVTSQLDVPLAPENIRIGPSDLVPWLTDRKWAYIRMEGTTFGGVPLNLEPKLEVWDSPNPDVQNRKETRFGSRNPLQRTQAAGRRMVGATGIEPVTPTMSR